MISFSATAQEAENDTIAYETNAWILKNNYTLHQVHEMDTGIDKNHHYNPLFQEGISYAYTGNIGGAYLSNIFNERDLSDFPGLFKPYQIYLRNPEEVIYYNTTRPFTAIHYSSQSGDRDVNEETVGVLHTQNIDESINVGFDIDYIGGKGHYLNQKTGITNGTVFGSVFRPRYEMHANVTLAKIQNQKNGGIEADSLLRSSRSSETTPVKLDMAATLIKYRSILFNQKFLLGKTEETADTLRPLVRKNVAALTHTMQFDMYKRTFSDEFYTTGSISGSDSAYWPRFIYNENLTLDSSHYRLLQNQLKFELIENPNKWYSFGGYVGLKNELQYQFSTTQHLDTTFVPKAERRTMNNAFIWSLNQNKKYYFTWNFNGSYYFTGYKLNNIDVHADISLRVSKKYPYQLTGYLKFSRLKPDLFYEHYISNHFQWNQSLNASTTRIIGAELRNPKQNLSLSTNLYSLTNFIYFNSDLIPEQFSTEEVFYTARLKKRTRFWKFVFDAEAIYQAGTKTSNISFPVWSLYGSLFFDHTIRFNFTGGAIALQLGADVYYNSEYKGYEYNPAVEQFYPQSVFDIGGYPYLNPFLNFQIQRMRVFLTYLHVNELFMNRDDYFSLVHYPRNPGVLKFGLNWSLYN